MNNSSNALNNLSQQSSVNSFGNTILTSPLLTTAVSVSGNITTHTNTNTRNSPLNSLNRSATNSINNNSNNHTTTTANNNSNNNNMHDNLNNLSTNSNSPLTMNNLSNWPNLSQQIVNLNGNLVNTNGIAPIVNNTCNNLIQNLQNPNFKASLTQSHSSSHGTTTVANRCSIDNVSNIENRNSMSTEIQDFSDHTELRLRQNFGLGFMID